MKCSVWFGSCCRPRTYKRKKTLGCWSWSRRCLAIVRTVLTMRKKITKSQTPRGQTWLIYSGENSRKNSRKMPNNLKTWINSKFGTRNFQLPVLVSTCYISLRIEGLSTRALRASCFLIVCLCCNFWIYKLLNYDHRTGPFYSVRLVFHVNSVWRMQCPIYKHILL